MAYWPKRLAVTGPVHDAAAVECRDQGGPAPDAAGDCSAAAGRAEAGNAKGAVEDVLHQSGQAAAMADDDQLQFPPQRMARHDAEVAADVGDDGADRAAADLDCDLLGVGRWARRDWVASVGWAGARAGGDGGGGSAWRRGRGGPAGRRCGSAWLRAPGAEQAAGDAREDLGDVAGAERVRVAAECGGELPAVVDELPDEGEEAAEPVGFGGGGGLGRGHKREMGTGGQSGSRHIFPVTPSQSAHLGKG